MIMLWGLFPDFQDFLFCTLFVDVALSRCSGEIGVASIMNDFD
jgi:hypothetical protein